MSLKSKMTILLAALSLGAAPAALGAVPAKINFQGKLLDTASVPQNGSFSLTFWIYDSPSGGTILWGPETQSAVPVANGVFAVQLGSVVPLPPQVFAAASAYLQIQIGSQLASSRQQLVTSPYAFRAAVADELAPGAAGYVAVTSSLQSGATFYVSSGTVAGPLIVGGVLVAGSGGNRITTPAGLLDAAKLGGVVPDAALSGSYSNALTLSSPANAFSGSGAGLTGVTAAHLLPGDTNYIQQTSVLQSGATFYVSSGTVAGSFAARGAVSLGGTPGSQDATVNGNLIAKNTLTVQGAGPHVFGGDVRLATNKLQDSAGVARLTLGAPNLISGGLSVPAGTPTLSISTSVVFNGRANQDNYIAYPFVAGAAIAAKQVVIVQAANSVGLDQLGGCNTAVFGVAVTTATAAGQTIWVATSGVVTGVTAGSNISPGEIVCTSITPGTIEGCDSGGLACGAAGGRQAFAKALGGAAVPGTKVAIILGL